jgi:hypothetical protein
MTMFLRESTAQTRLLPPPAAFLATPLVNLAVVTESFWHRTNLGARGSELERLQARSAQFAAWLPQGAPPFCFEGARPLRVTLIEELRFDHSVRAKVPEVPTQFAPGDQVAHCVEITDDHRPDGRREGKSGLLDAPVSAAADIGILVAITVMNLDVGVERQEAM